MEYWKLNKTEKPLKFPCIIFKIVFPQAVFLAFLTRGHCVRKTLCNTIYVLYELPAIKDYAYNVFLNVLLKHCEAPLKDPNSIDDLVS